MHPISIDIYSIGAWKYWEMRGNKCMEKERKVRETYAGLSAVTGCGVRLQSKLSGHR